MLGNNRRALQPDRSALQQTGRTYWACRPCTVYSQGLTHRMREIENQLTEVKATCGKNEEGLQKVQAEVSKLAEKVSKQEKRVEEMASVSGQDLFKELREREVRKLNLVMYGMGEAPAERTGFERWDWDMMSCNNLIYRPETECQNRRSQVLQAGWRAWWAT
jgi:hypothetical protein